MHNCVICNQELENHSLEQLQKCDYIRKLQKGTEAGGD